MLVILGFFIGVAFSLAGIFLFRHYVNYQPLLFLNFYQDIFKNVVSDQVILRFRKKMLREFPKLKDYQIYILHSSKIITSYPNTNTNLNSSFEEINVLIKKSLHREIRLPSNFYLSFVQSSNHVIIARGYHIPILNIRILILAFFPPKTRLSYSQKQSLHIINTVFSLTLFSLEAVRDYKDLIKLVQEIFWDSPYAVGFCTPKGELVLGNDALYQLFQGSIPNFRELADPEVFSLLLDGKRIGKTFSFRGKNVRLEAYPLSNKNFLVTRCFFVFYDEQIERKRTMLGETNTLRRFAGGNPAIGTAMFTTDGTLLYSNEAFMNSLHILKAREAKQKNIYDLFELTEPEFQKIVEAVSQGREVLQNISSIEREQEFSVRFKGMVFGEQTIVEVMLEQENFFNENYSFLDKETQEIYEELHTARSVQEHILSLPTIYTPGISVDTLYAPSRQLSGDFFSVVPFGDRYMGFLMADVSGHGVSASLITAALKILIEFAPNEPDQLPKIISYLNTYLEDILPEGSFVTLFYGILNLDDYTFRYINCGHPFPILEDQTLNETKILEGMGFPLGGLLNVSFDELIRTIQMPAKGKLFFYTDGLLQHLSGTMKDKLDKMRAVIEQNRKQNDKTLLSTVYHRFVARNTNIPEDDVSMMLVSFDRKRTRKHSLAISSTLIEVDTAIARIGEYIQKEAHLPPNVYWRLHTAFYEALLNAVVHGNKYNTQKKVFISYRITDDLIVIRVRDEGTGFNSRQIADPLDEQNVLKAFGRGIKMINTLADKIKFNEKGNEITLFFYIKEKNS